MKQVTELLFTILLAVCILLGLLLTYAIECLGCRLSKIGKKNRPAFIVL